MVSTLDIQLLTAPKSLTFQWLLAQSRRPVTQHNGTISNMQTQDVGPNPNVPLVLGMNVTGPQSFLEQGHPSYEWHRRSGADARDPRCLGGPCQGSHRRLARRSNQHAAYYHCEDCNLRILYIPRIGARGTPKAAGLPSVDVYGVAAPQAPPKPTPVPVYPQLSPAYEKAGPKGASVGKTAATWHCVRLKQPPPTPNTAAQGPALSMPSAMAPPMASPPQSASATIGAGHAISSMAPSPVAPPATPQMAPTGSMLASSSSALPPQEEILGALQMVTRGISDLSLRMENSELQVNQANADTQDIAQRLVQLEGRANQTETALVKTTQMAFTSHQMAALSLPVPPAASPDLSTIAVQPEGVETWPKVKARLCIPGFKDSSLPQEDPNSLLAGSDLTLSDAEE